MVNVKTMSKSAIAEVLRILGVETVGAEILDAAQRMDDEAMARGTMTKTDVLAEETVSNTTGVAEKPADEDRIAALEKSVDGIKNELLSAIKTLNDRLDASQSTLESAVNANNVIVEILKQVKQVSENPNGKDIVIEKVDEGVSKVVEGDKKTIADAETKSSGGRMKTTSFGLTFEE